MLLEGFFGDDGYLITDSHHKDRPNQLLQGDLIDCLAIIRKCFGAQYASRRARSS